MTSPDHPLLNYANSKEVKFFMTLVEQRIDILQNDLVIRFGISIGSQIFITWFECSHYLAIKNQIKQLILGVSKKCSSKHEPLECSEVFTRWV